MGPLNRRVKFAIVVLIIGIVLSLNFATLIQSLPESQKIDAGCCAPGGTLLAKDFSAFYFGAWRLFHNASGIYDSGSLANASFLGIKPHPESFKYLPFFLLLVSPLLFLNYQQAFLVFDLFQFVLLFLISILIYKILEGRNIAIIAVISILALLLPFSTSPNWEISEAYFWQWAEGQSKILGLTFILLAFYYARKKRPILSGVSFGLSFFDPRFALISIPLFVTLNGKGKLLLAASISATTILITNTPILLLSNVGSSFIEMLSSGGLATPIYPYAYIPLVTIVSLSVAFWKEIWQAFTQKDVQPKSQVRAGSPKSPSSV